MMPSARTAVVALVALTSGVVVGCGDDDPMTADLSPGLPITGDPGQLGTQGDTARNAAAIDSVVMIGDSITKGSRPAIEERFDRLGMDPVTIEAENGKRMVISSPDNLGGSTIAEIVAELGGGEHDDELWVVALGTNDIGNYDGPDEIAAAVNEVLAAVPEEAALVWVDTYFRDRPEQQEVVNSIIRDRVERRGNSVVAPWSTFATGEGVMTGDGVHPTPGGTEVFAFVVTDTARAFLGR